MINRKVSGERYCLLGIKGSYLRLYKVAGSESAALIQVTRETVNSVDGDPCIHGTLTQCCVNVVPASQVFRFRANVEDIGLGSKHRQVRYLNTF